MKRLIVGAFEHWATVRDAILMTGGLLGVLHQEFSATAPRPELLAVYAIMMGLPGVWAIRKTPSNGTGG